MGTVSKTVSGKECQSWSSNTPHVQNARDSDDLFPDGSRAAAENYCRNPDPDHESGVWCYTMDPNTETESCDVPLCCKSMLLNGVGKNSERFYLNRIVT